MNPRMKEKFQGPVSEQVKQTFKVANPMALPRLDKIVITVGMGKQLDGTKLNATAKTQVLDDLSTITGQKAVMKTAKKAVSNFKLRVGYEVGAMVTMRGDRPKAPRTAELTGSCPGITEGMSTEDYIGSLRDTEQP